MAEALRFAFDDLAADIGPWLLLGIGIAGLITALIPAGFIEAHLGSGIVPMIVMLAVGIPVFVCATASTPVVAALAAKGLSPGAALVFLLAGPVTNAATITVLGKILGKRVTAVYLATIAAASLGLGLFVDWLYLSLALDIAGWVRGAELEEGGPLAVASAVLLLGLVIKALLPAWRHGHAKA